MNILEKKTDLCLRWILAEDGKKRDEIAAEAAALLREGADAGRCFTAEDYVEDLLKELGVSQGILGFKYLAHAVGLVLTDWGYVEGVTKGLYPAVAKRFGSTASRVERAMRHAVEGAFNAGDVDELMKLFGGGVSKFKGKVTNCEFVAGCAREVKRRMRP